MASYKNSAKYRDKQVHLVRDAAIHSILQEIKNSTNPKRRDPYNVDIWNKGMQWFESGLLSEDADESVRYNTNFTDGYAFAERKEMLNRRLEELGEKWFLEGNDLEDANQMYLDNAFFIKGYNNALRRKKR